jgi:hypothetical protein
MAVLGVGNESLKEMQAKAVKQIKDVSREGNGAGRCAAGPDKRET